MFAMFKQCFSAFTMFFASLERLMKATEHITQWCEESAGQFADEARIARQAKLTAMLKENNITEAKFKAVDAPTQQAA